MTQTTITRKNSRQQQKQKQSKFIQEPLETVDGNVHIKKYIKLKIVGSGSYSKCYLVKNTDSDSTYVAKIIPKKKLQILQKQKLIYEIKIHQSLSHPNVVHLDHWFEDQNFQYIFMQYCPNGNLQGKIGQNQGLQQNQIRRYSQQIVSAIGYIHSQNILHRDLKLCNFYLDEKNNVKLGDFGFACQLANIYDRKRETCGTPNYIAPQAISGFGYSYSSDVWAIGVILYRLKYGYCPFQGQSVKKTLQNVKLCLYKFPSKPKISAQLRDLIEKIFNLNYDERLTTQQILAHKFFNPQINIQQNNNKKQLKQQKRGFSLSRLFSRQKTKQKQQQKINKRQDIMQRETRNQYNNNNNGNNGNKKQQPPKRSNSCETFKQIKQIFKNKSKNNLATTTTQPNQTTLSTSPYYTLNTVTSMTMTNRQKQKQRDRDTVSTIMATKTMTNRQASINQYNQQGTFNDSMMIGSKKIKDQQSRSNRLNQFIKSQVNNIPLKQQLKANKQNNSSKNYIVVNQKQKQKQKEKKQLQNQTTNKQKQKNSILIINKNQQIHTNNQITQFGHSKSSLLSCQQQLYTYCRKYYFPFSIQQQKDIIIINYKPSIKHIIHNNTNSNFIIHRNIQNIYKLINQHENQKININQIPKVIKYILETKLQIKDQIQQQYQYTQYDIQNNIKKILQKIPINYNILKDGIILKYENKNNHNIIIAKLFAQDTYFVYQQGNTSFLYNIQSGHLKVVQGIVIMRIYNGWVKTYMKK